MVIYLDKNYKACQKFIIEKLIAVYIDLESLVQTTTNYKSKIVEWIQKNRKTLQFELVNEHSYKNFREFTVQVIIDGQVVGQGCSKIKKKAEQIAAKQACKAFNVT